MSEQEPGAFPSFGGFNSDEPLEGILGRRSMSMSLSNSTGSSSDDGRRGNVSQIFKRKKPPATTGKDTIMGKSDSTTAISSNKDKLSQQSVSKSDEDNKTSKQEKAQAVDDKKDQKPPAKEDIASVQSEQRSTASIAPSMNRSNYSTRSRPSRQQRFAAHTILATQDPSSVIDYLFVSIEQERQMHKLAGQNLRAVNNWLLFLPAIALTLASGVISLISESGLNISDDSRTYLSIVVGVVALVAVFWQALTKQMDLGSRVALHEATSIALKRLSEDILLTMSSTDDVPTEYVTMVSEKFGQALDSCASLIPLRIESAFSAVKDRLVLILRPPTGQPRKQFYKKDFMRFHATAYDELTSEIIHHWLWPFHIPPPRGAADNALRNFKEIITEGKEASRWGSDNRLCPCFGNRTTERSLFDVLPAASLADEQEFIRRPGGTEV